MSRYRDQAIVLVAEMRKLWPLGVDELSIQAGINEVNLIKDKLISYIMDMGAHTRTVSKILGIGFKDGPSTRRDLEYQDALQQFWFGVVNGLALVKSRISPDGEIDINDPLEFLISKGKWAVLDMKRSANLKRLMQTCYVCNSTHKLFRPNISSLAFDKTLCVKIRGNRDDDFEAVSEYRKKLLLEKIRRSPVKNPCKECYNNGVINWYPIHGPTTVGTDEFEADLASIDFMVFSVDTDVIELFISHDPNTEDEEVNFIENSPNNVFNELLYNPYDSVDSSLDSQSIKNVIIYDEDDQIYGFVYDTIYNGSTNVCKICPKRAKLLVRKNIYTYADIRSIITKIICGVDDGVYLGDWETEYASADECGGLPMNDCDNVNVRISNFSGIHINKVREIRKVIDNRYNAYMIVDDIIHEAMEQLGVY